MKGVIWRPGSPYYWIRFYDELEIELSKKRKNQNTKIEITAADWKRIESRKPGEKIKFQGTPELWRKVKQLRIALADRKFEVNTNSKISRKLLLSEGYAEFKNAKTVPGSKGELKKKTIINYEIAVAHMIAACKDKPIYKYTAEKDYVALLQFFEAYKVRGKKIKNKTKTTPAEYEYHDLSTNSRSNYTRALKSLWTFFVLNKFADHNIIEPVRGEDKDPDPIALSDMVIIVNYFKAGTDNPHFYWIVYFLLLTGCRPSSAIVQMKEDIDFTQRIITIRNVKTGKSKSKLSFRFPLYKELADLLKAMGVKQGDKGRLFDMYDVVPEYYTQPLRFWERGMRFLKKAGKIEKEYNLKQIRPTFMSFLINILKIDIYTVKNLADHTDIKVTDKNYIDFNLRAVRKILDDVTLKSFLDID